MKKSDEFVKNFEISIKKYQNFYQSNHWTYNNKKKTKLYKFENLKNFRNNGLSYGLDDDYSKAKTLNLYKVLRKKYDRKTLFSMFDNRNIGSPKNFIKKEKFYITGNELVHIKHLLDFKDKVSLSRNSVICEIGSGYGSLISKIIKYYNSKVILIDLPESNFLSHYYLKKLFPKKKFLLSSEIKKQLSIKQILKNDIIILCPWDKLPKIQIDFYINSRSMMEMTYPTINHYFNLIKQNLKIGGYFLCINRYYKDTVGYPIELIKYPFGKNWTVLVSKKSWLQDHIHYLLFERTKKPNIKFKDEIKKLKILSNGIKKHDPFFIRRILNNSIYKIYKISKYAISKIF